MPLQHFSDVATPLSIPLVEGIERRNSRTPADVVTHHSQGCPGQHVGLKMPMYSELDAQVVQSSSIRPIVLHLLLLILFCWLGCLSLFSRRAGSLWCNRQMRHHVEPPPAHHLSPSSSSTSTALRSVRALLFSRTRCLSDSVLACMNPCFSRQGFLNSLSEFLLTWFCRFSMQNKQRVSRTSSHVSVTRSNSSRVCLSWVVPQPWLPMSRQPERFKRAVS